MAKQSISFAWWSGCFHLAEDMRQFNHCGEELDMGAINLLLISQFPWGICEPPNDNKQVNSHRPNGWERIENHSRHSRLTCRWILVVRNHTLKYFAWFAAEQRASDGRKELIPLDVDTDAGAWQIAEMSKNRFGRSHAWLLLIVAFCQSNLKHSALQY